MNINFNGYSENAVTFLTTDGVEKNMLVKVTSNGTVAPCASGDTFCGVCVDVRGGYATVVTSGYVNMPANKTIAVGYQKLSASSATAVTSGTSGREYLVVESDTTSVGFIL